MIGNARTYNLPAPISQNPLLIRVGDMYTITVYPVTGTNPTGSCTVKAIPLKPIRPKLPEPRPADVYDFVRVVINPMYGQKYDFSPAQAAAYTGKTFCYRAPKSEKLNLGDQVSLGGPASRRGGVVVGFSQTDPEQDFGYSYSAIRDTA